MIHISIGGWGCVNNKVLCDDEDDTDENEAVANRFDAYRPIFGAMGA